jgi:hypothetical protein
MRARDGRAGAAREARRWRLAGDDVDDAADDDFEANSRLDGTEGDNAHAHGDIGARRRANARARGVVWRRMARARPGNLGPKP